MTNSTQLIDLIGKPSDAPEVVAWLSKAGGKPPKLKKGDTNANVVLSKLGLELAFDDEAMLFSRKDLAIGEGALILTAVFFDLTKDPKHAAFADPLPFGIAATSSQADMHKLLGKPEESDPDLNLERWTHDGKWVFANYEDGWASMWKLTVQMVDPPK